MPLTGSGQISFNDVRVEMSQSAAPNYAFTEWAAGAWQSGSNSYNNYTPINLNSFQKPFTSSSLLNVYSGVSMSQWYSYTSSTAISLNTTSSLYYHCADYCYPSSMVVFNAGTSNITASIRISGSAIYPYAGWWVIYYGKPWKNDGKYDTLICNNAVGKANDAIVIASGSTQLDYNTTIKYNYVYNSSTGSNIYFVLYQDNCFSP
jgi:hypothetical protein